uniref:Inheritance of peroxisomes protein 1 n=1 Tax=Rhabditophanes sp. KR3021 TaxID=114890 RepID=A0AC35TRX0_9BILA
MDTQIIEILLKEVLTNFEQGNVYEEDGQDDLSQLMYNNGLTKFDKIKKMPEIQSHTLFPQIESMQKKILTKLSAENLPEVKVDIVVTKDTEDELTFFIPGDVKLFIIDGDSTTVLADSTSLEIFKYNPPLIVKDGDEEMKAEAYIKVGSWVYPLITNKTPVLESEFNTFVVPNPIHDKPNMCVSIMLPQEIDIALKKDFVKLLKSLTEFRVNDDATTQMTETEKKRMSERIALCCIRNGGRAGAKIRKAANKGSKFILKKGLEKRSNSTPNQVPTIMNPIVKHSIFYIHKSSKAVSKATGKWLESVGNLGANLGEKLVKKCDVSPGRLATGTSNIIEGGIIGLAMVFIALAEANKTLLKNIADESIEFVNHKYGQDAATTVHKGVYCLGHAGISAIHIIELRPISVVRRMGMSAGMKVVNEFSDLQLGPTNTTPLAIEEGKKNQ